MRIGLVGLGWYGGDVARLLLRLARRRGATIELVGGYDVRLDPTRPAHTVLATAGLPVTSDWSAFLELRPDAAWLTVPIAAHRPAVEAALAANLAVLVEKPAAGSIQDVDAMIAAARRAARPVIVAYQAIYDPAIAELKRRLVDGAIGVVRSASVHAADPRGDSYWARAPWAGRLGDAASGWILDGPAMNANAHAVNLAWYLLGDSMDGAAAPAEVEAELYRANPIESADVITVRARTADAIPVTVAMGHGCARTVPRCVRVEGERGAAMVLGDRVVLADRRGTWIAQLSRDPRPPMLATFARVAAGDRPGDAGVMTLEAARSQVLLLNGAFAATPIVDVPDDAVRMARTPMGRARAIPGLEELLALSAARGATLSELGGVPWARPPGRFDLRSMARFEGLPLRS